MKSLVARWFAVGALSLIVAGCAVKMPVAGHTPRTDFGKATGPEGWEAAFWEAVQKKDYAGIERHLTTNYVFSGPTGKMDKAGFLQVLRTVELQGYQMSDVQVVPQGSDFVVSYTLKVEGTMGGKPFPHAVTRLVSVWQQQKRGAALVTQGEWVAGQATNN